MFALCLLIFVLQGVVHCAVDCSHQANGNYEITCTSYISCQNGIHTEYTCATNQMYNPVTKKCASTTNLPPPCTITHDCSGLPNRKFADSETNCETYYTCHNGYFYGHNFCSPGLVFDENMQSCNWPYNVPKPCGTLDIALVG